MLRSLFRMKPLDTIDTTTNQEPSLRRCLTALDLILLGIGAIIGAGVFVLTGVAAATKAGPAITISFIIAGGASMFAALAYAELAASISGCGSAYSYAYAGFGEFIAWVIGWNLLLEYIMAVSSVAIGWSGYVTDMLKVLGIHTPIFITKNLFEGGLVNLPAMLIVMAIALLLCIGAKQSARFNAIIVFIKLIAITIFIVVATDHVQVQNWSNFFPFGWSGVVSGAALVFFAYIGFDALSTTVEETISPQRDIPIGIIVSLVICTVVYIIVSILLTGIVNYTTLNTASPVANALLSINRPFVAGIVAAGAIAGLTTVILVMYYGLTRIFLAMSRDGLLPAIFAKVHSKTQTPVTIILLSGIVIALIAGFTPIEKAAELVNIGTLTAFVFVCAGVIVLRYTKPSLHRPFKLPWNPLLPLLGVLSCGYLMLNLSDVTWWRFSIWTLLGVIIYFAYSWRHSVLSK
ncbi:MAG: amino acid permease [Gammaproteobacteria bacterium RIFCSPHIGHO2_12_FULL_41_20]|nr:MAG: amino acid permease [Gammaproteobacteria bacterium RIFCSPHIGHO2_12_FULL_41_20]